MKRTDERAEVEGCWFSWFFTVWCRRFPPCCAVIFGARGAKLAGTAGSPQLAEPWFLHQRRRQEVDGGGMGGGNAAKYD